MSDAQAVLIVGAGWIGRQVGLRMAVHGFKVFLVDRLPSALESARQWMQANAQLYIQASQSPEGSSNASAQSAAALSVTQPAVDNTAAMADRAWESRVCFDRSIESLIESVQVVLECVSEQITLKRRILREVSRQFPSTTIIASNSSYFTPSTLAKFVDSPKRFANWHFHVPLHRKSIADVSGCPATEPWVLERLEQWSRQMGQSPLLLRHEQPGYVFNWLLQSLLKSALELAARDVVDIADIDRAWKAVSGMPIGPFAIMDNIGLDVIEQALSNARWDNTPPIELERLLAVLRVPLQHGHLGIKSGQGFYQYAQAEVANGEIFERPAQGVQRP